MTNQNLKTDQEKWHLTHPCDKKLWKEFKKYLHSIKKEKKKHGQTVWPQVSMPLWITDQLFTVLSL